MATGIWAQVRQEECFTGPAEDRRGAETQQRAPMRGGSRSAQPCFAGLGGVLRPGTRLMAYRAVDHHVYTRVRLFLIRRHKVPSPGAGRYPDAEVSGRLGCCACAVSICRRCREPEVKSVGRPDARNGHVRFDERGWETGRRFGVSARTRPRLYPQGFSSHGCAPPRTARHSCHGLACSQEATAMLFLPHNARSVRFRTPSFRKIW